MPSIPESTVRAHATTAGRPACWLDPSLTASRSAAGAADVGRPRAPEAVKAAGRESASGRSDGGCGGGRAPTGTDGLVICAKSVRDTVKGRVGAELSAVDALGLRFPGRDLVASAAALFERTHPWAHGRDRTQMRPSGAQVGLCRERRLR